MRTERRSTARTTRRWSRKIGPIIVLLCMVILVGGIWEALVGMSNISPIILPGPGLVISALAAVCMEAVTWGHVGSTLAGTISGFAAGTACGVALAVAMSKSAFLNRVAMPLVVILQVTPKVALVPLLIVWFGFGSAPKIIVAAAFAFFPVLLNTLVGLQSVNTGHRDVMKSMKASPWQTFVHLEVRASLPFILTGMDIGIILALTGTVVAEYLGGNHGLGFLLIKTMNSFQTDRMFAIIALMSGLGLLLHGLMVRARATLVPWHRSGH